MPRKKAYSTTNANDENFVNFFVAGQNLMGREVKQFTTRNSHQCLLYDAVLNEPLEHLDQVPRGTSSEERVGVQYKILSAHVRIAVQPSAVAGPAPSPAVSRMRFLLVWDKAPNGKAPLYTDLFRTNVAKSQLVDGPLGFVSIDSVSRFEVLKDVLIKVGPRLVNNGGGAWTSDYLPPDNMWEWNVDLNKTAFTKSFDATGEISNRVSGALFLAAFCDQPDALSGFQDPTGAHIYEYASRIFYQDQ